MAEQPSVSILNLPPTRKPFPQSANLVKFEAVVICECRRQLHIVVNKDSPGENRATIIAAPPTGVVEDKTNAVELAELLEGDAELGLDISRQRVIEAAKLLRRLAAA